MEGFWFYWAMWLIILGIYFFDSNQKRKEEYVFLLLFLVISSGIVLPIGGLSIRLSFILLGFLCFYQLTKFRWKEKLYYYFVIAFLSGAYYLIQYFIYFEPVWLFLSPLVTVITVACVLVVVFIKDQKSRLYVVTTALIQGEVIFIYSLWERSHIYFDSIVVGDFLMLDMFSLAILILIIWNSLEIGTGFLRNKWAPYPPKPVGQGKLNA